MRKRLHSFLGTGVCIFMLLTLNQPVLSQSISTGTPGLEVGLNFGPMNFLGDVGGNYGKGTTFLKDNNFAFFRLMKGGYIAANVSHFLAFRLNINFGELAGHDSVINAKGGMEEARRVRDLGFKSKLFEGYIAAEIYPTVLLEDDPSDTWHKLRPYGIIGVGMFNFNPQGLYIAPNGERRWVDLKPLRTEGQGMAEYPDRKEYKLTEICIPIGAGVKYFVTEKFHIGAEVLHRVTFTDYIDDVSTNYIDPAHFSNYMTPDQAAIARQMADRQNYFQANTRPGFTRNVGDKRGNPKQSDAYFSFAVKFGWRIGNASSKGLLRQSQCPVW